MSAAAKKRDDGGGQDKQNEPDEADPVSPMERRLGMYSLLGILAYGFLRLNRTRKGFESFRNIGGGTSGTNPSDYSSTGLVGWLTHHPGLLIRVVPGVLLFVYVALQMRKKVYKTKVNKDGKRFQTSLLLSMLTSVATHALDELKPSDLGASSGSGLIDKAKLLMETGASLGLGVPLIPFLLKSKRTKNYLFRHGMSLLAWVPLAARFTKNGIWTMLFSSNKGGDLIGALLKEAPFAASCFGHHISALLLGDTQLSKRNRWVAWGGWLAMYAGRGLIDWLPWNLIGGKEGGTIAKIALQGISYFAFAHSTPMVWTAVNKIVEAATGKEGKKDS